jgi:hypothetical protein
MKYSKHIANQRNDIRFDFVFGQHISDIGSNSNITDP